PAVQRLSQAVPRPEQPAAADRDVPPGRRRGPARAAPSAVQGRRPAAQHQHAGDRHGADARRRGEGAAFAGMGGQAEGDRAAADRGGEAAGRAAAAGSGDASMIAALFMVAALPVKVSIAQHLNAQLPLDVMLRDETGKVVRLGDYFHHGRPVLLNFVYYNCPMLCPMVLEGMTSTLTELKFDVGREFDVFTL